MQDLGVGAEEWQCRATIAIVVDGAKNLVCSMAKQLGEEKEMSHLQSIYCGFH